MQVLLTPLFFCQRVGRTCVRLYYKDHPAEWIWQYELEPMPPLGYFQSSHAFIPDYALLLMFEEFIVTEEAFDRITRAPRPWLGEWPRVLRLLKDEGALSTIDLKQEMAKSSTARAVMLRHDMKTPSKWAHAMAHHDALLAFADKAFGKAPQKAVAPSWKFQARHLPGVEGSDGQTHVLSSAPLGSPGNNPNDPHFQLDEVAVASLKNQLREVNAGIAVASALNAFPMFWAPYARYLRAKSADAPGASNAMADANAARRLFSVAFPRYAPDTVQRLGRLRSDKRVRRPKRRDPTGGRIQCADGTGFRAKDP